MPTPKQVRHHYKRCRQRSYMLLTALREAHDAGVIDYEAKYNIETKQLKDTLPSVCDAVYVAKENFEAATKKQLANAMRTEILDELKGVW